MKKNLKGLKSALDAFIGKKTVKVEIVVGTVLYFYFGLLVESIKSSKSNQMILSTDDLIYFDWYWSIVKDNEIIVSSDIQGDNEYIYANQLLNTIDGKILQKYEFDIATNELKLFFEDGFIVRTYNQLVKKYSKRKEYEDSNIFVLFNPKEYYAASVRGPIEHKLRSPRKYVTDYEENPDKYIF